MSDTNVQFMSLRYYQDKIFSKCFKYVFCVLQGRDGETNTTGHSSNFIFYIYLPSDKDTFHWTNRGVAATCQVDI